MAIIGIDTNRKNPVYTSEDFLFWMPQFTNFLATESGAKTFDKMYNICNSKIFYSIYGTDWELAISYAIAHYITLLAKNDQAYAGSTLSEIAGGGTTQGVITSASIGGFSKSYDISSTLLSGSEYPEALFWNQTSYGQALMALYKTKAVPSIFVVTAGRESGRKPPQKVPFVGGSVTRISGDDSSESRCSVTRISGNDPSESN